MIKKDFPTPAVSMDLEQGIMITPFVSPWSTMTIMESILRTSGRSVDQVDQELSKGKGGCGGDGIQWWANWVGVYFVLLANCATFNKFVDIGS